MPRYVVWAVVECDSDDAANVLAADVEAMCSEPAKDYEFSWGLVSTTPNVGWLDVTDGDWNLSVRRSAR